MNVKTTKMGQSGESCVILKAAGGGGDLKLNTFRLAGPHTTSNQSGGS